MTENQSYVERQLSIVIADQEAIMKRLLSFPHGSPERDELRVEYGALELKESNIRRHLAELTGDEHAIRLGLGVRPEAAVSGGLLVQSEDKCFLIFNISGSLVNNCIPQAVVEFKHPIKTQFGSPNDEALVGHPLSGLGLDSYDAFEVLNSRWDEEERRRNQIAFPGSTGKCRHFIFTFHDSTFECLAGDLSVTVEVRSFEDIWQDLLLRVAEG